MSTLSLGAFRVSADVADHAAAFMFHNTSAFRASAPFMASCFCMQVVAIFKHVGLDCFSNGISTGKYTVFAIT